MNALLDSLRKDLDTLSAKRAQAREHFNATRRELNRIKRDYDRALMAVIAVEEELRKINK